MKKKLVISVLLILGLATASNAGSTYDLKTNMNLLSANFSDVQQGILRNDCDVTEVALKKFKKEVDSLLGDRERMKKLLSKDLKKKAVMATNTANNMDKYIAEMQAAISNKSLKKIDRQNRTQKAYLNIQNQCFRCHNMVRDWE